MQLVINGGVGPWRRSCPEKLSQMISELVDLIIEWSLDDWIILRYLSIFGMISFTNEVKRPRSYSLAAASQLFRQMRSDVQRMSSWTLAEAQLAARDRHGTCANDVPILRVDDDRVPGASRGKNSRIHLEHPKLQ